MTNRSIAFDRAADFYDNTRGFPPGQEKPSVALLAQAGKLTPASRVLEIGIGTGRIALPLAEHVGSVIGVDLARPMMNRLRAKQTTERIALAEADGTRLPFADATFDAVVGVHIFHLIPSWREVLVETARVLKPGALLLIGWNDNGAIIPHEALDVAFDSAQRKSVGISQDQNRTFASEAGWRLVGDEHVYTYPFAKTPQSVYEEAQQRTWSASWTMPDEQLAAGLAKLKAYIDANYADPNAPVTVENSFHAQAYAP